MDDGRPSWRPGGYARLRESVGFLWLRDVVPLILRGEDRLEWIQGQSTNDMRSLAPGDQRSFCLCSATGHIQAVVDAWATDDSLLLTTDPIGAEAMLERVERMVILEDVTIERPEGTGIYTIQGPLAEMAEGRFPHVKDAQKRRSARTEFGGWDVWLATDEPEFFESVSSEIFEVARIEAGIPRMDRDIGRRTLPPELGPKFEAGHVSYQKGCYVGQEVLMRLHSRGHTNRLWVGLLADKPLCIGAKLSHPDRADAGVVTSAAISPRLGPIGAAMIRREYAEPGTVLTEEGGVSVRVAAFPLG